MSSSGKASIGLLLLCALSAVGAPPGGSAGEEAEALPWLATLDDGYREALDCGTPVLVRVQTRSCPWCLKLAGQMRIARVRDELLRWTLVDLDADRSPDEAGRLAVEAVPALRVLTPRGRLVGSLDGYADGDELLQWLKEQRDALATDPDEALLGTGKPDEIAVVKLVRSFGERNPMIRQAASRRTVAHPEAMAPSVVKAFRDGNLATRLTALEVLHVWRAPIEALDPWRPETLTGEMTAGLEKWLKETAGVEMPASETLSDEQLDSARSVVERMLTAAPHEADAIRERLAAFGAGLLPEVYRQLAQTEDDVARQQLLALRYRLVADDYRALTWKEGLVRLAATDSRMRQRAAGELADTAGHRDQALLLELFSDPDPLVREISLRGLQQIGGKEAAAALVKLLEDPAANVRAAVLKQVLESPTRAMVPMVAKYLESEEDADLVVHAIRYLRAAGGKAALESLVSLLDHPRWQVRAEAAEGIGTLVQSAGYSTMSYRGEQAPGKLSQELIASGYVALIELLDDSDAFVVSRTVKALERADMELAVEPLAEAARKHPDLATTIVEILANGENMCEKAVPHFRKFAKHEHPSIRAASIRGLAQSRPDEMNEELAGCLKDPIAEVRLAAAEAVFGSFEESRRSAMNRLSLGESGADMDSWEFRRLAGSVSRETLRQMVAEAAKSAGDADDAGEDIELEATREPGAAADDGDVSTGESWDNWLKEHYEGKNWPKSIAESIGLLEGMLKAETAEERVAAALALVPAGKADMALPVLAEAVGSERGLFDRAASMLPWLTWENRVAAFGQFRKLALNKQDLVPLIEAMASIPDHRSSDLLWEFLADETLTAQEIRPVQQGLLQAYLGDSYYSPEDASIGRRRELRKAATRYANTGKGVQRQVGLTLLAAVDPEEAGDIAIRLAGNSALDEKLQLTAFRLALATRPKEEAIQTAIATLTAADNTQRRMSALLYLVDGRRAMMSGDDAVMLPNTYHEEIWSGTNSGQPIIPFPPSKLEPEHVGRLLDHADPRTRAYAGYLLALFEQPQGLDKLLVYWREHGENEPGLDRLAYRAIASLDDSTQISVLEKIYERLEPYDAGEFYWTVRIMSGPGILRLRKRIRDEVGMDNLK